MKKLGYLGPEGTFSHGAAKRYCERVKEEYKLSWHNSIYEIATSVRNGDLDIGIVPIENSIDGAVNQTLDVLIAFHDLFIYECYDYKVRQNLIGPKGLKIDKIKEVFSHPQPIGQCRDFLNNELNHAKINLTYSTAAGAKMVKEKGNCENGYAAIGTIDAASLFELDVIKKDIQDTKNNVTRFVILSKEMNKEDENTKSSIVFSTDDKPGSLFKALEIFDLWDVNLKKIESRPAKKALGRYIFYVDVEGDFRELNLKEAFRLLKMKTSFFSFLGSYPERFL